ncbi:hypothetical protein [Desmospora activa]|uniref:Uncharacterized protein n=1 Tax=Desmospora activa DSM 45169 TaxID=1121389 RepID=A0A2T4Z8P7_9BACL|nr:hypothetical protein [Desmospora activa]PTM58248.1 hypothetical protein C8J48_0828 [Desmospora activa DSM 45169]
MDKRRQKSHNSHETDGERQMGGWFLTVVKSTVRSMYRGLLMILILSFLLLSTVLLLAFLADPQLMWDSVRKAFGM